MVVGSNKLFCIYCSRYQDGNNINNKNYDQVMAKLWNGISLGPQKLLVIITRPGNINNQLTRFGLTHRPRNPAQAYSVRRTRCPIKGQ